MKLNKGLTSDTRPVDQPGETYPFGKNGIGGNTRNARENEPGFRLMNMKVPYGKPNGLIETDKHPVVFCTDNTNSAIGYYDEINDVFIPILDDASLPFKLGFKMDNYITGTAQRNYLAQVIVVYTDKNQPPSYLNCDVPNVQAPEDLLLFPIATPPTIAINQSQGGALVPGAYYAAVRYFRNDGTQTTFLVQSDQTFVTGDPNVVQNVGLVITLTNVDPNYDYAEVAIVSKIGGKLDQQLMDPVKLESTTVITYTGAEATTLITLEEVLQSPVNYTKVRTMGQLNDYLYIAGLETPQQVVMQQYAQLVKIKWISELHNTFPADPKVVSGQRRGFYHREVYALYIQYSLTAGGWSRAFNIPGAALLPADLVNSTQAAAGGVTTQKFKVEDTIPSFDASSFTGSMGKWQNANEVYPDTPDFDASGIGGENLRGKPVRHHRFPSLRFCKQNLYQFEPNYGKNKMDVLGLVISNVIIPQQYASQITGYRILYAQRNSGNSTVIAQSLFMEGGRALQPGQKYDPTSQAMAGPLTNFISPGGNWFSQVNRNNSGARRPIYPDPRILRFHAFDLLFDKPSISPSYICNELKMKITNLADSFSYIEDGDAGKGPGEDFPIVLKLDYLTNALTPTVPADNLVFRKVLASTYVPNNLINGDWENTQLEGCFGMTLQGPQVLFIGNPGSQGNPQDDPNSEFSSMSLVLHRNAEPASNIPQFENTFLTNLMFLRDDLYNTFTSQNLIVANSRVNGTGTATILSGGDVFINDYSFHEYGWIDALNDSYQGLNNPLNGMRVVRRFSCEAASNINTRFVIAGNDYSKYYPKNPLTQNDVTNYLTLFDRTNEPNQFGYTKDNNSLNALSTATIFSDNNTDNGTVYQFPYRIHRGGFLDRLNKRRNWHTFDPLDFYEGQKNLGLIVYVDGIDDRLMIHYEKGLLITQDKTTLNTDVIAVTLGAGDIFQFPPQPAMSSKLGYAGNQNDLACLVTPMGYIFVDAAQGQVFQWKGGLKLLNEGLSIFLRDALRVKGVNVFTGNGVTIGFDPYYKRLLMTVKNQQLLSQTVTPVPFQATPEFMATLTPGVSLVIKDGRIERYLGVNSTQYSCDVDPIPVVPNYVIQVPDNTAVNVQVLQTAGINVDDYYILTGNIATAFKLDAPSGKLFVAGPLNATVTAQYILQCRGTNNEGFSTAFSITVNILSTSKPPITGDQEVHIPEHSAIGTPVTQVIASDPNNLPLTYTIVGGNTGSAFSIDGAGNIVVATPAVVDYITNPVFLVTVAVSNGIFTVNANIKVDVDFVNEPPSSNDVIVTIYDTTPDGTQIVDLSQAVIDRGAQDGLQTLVFAVISDPSGGLFDINNTTGIVKVHDNSGFDPATTPQYIIQMRATDNGNPPMSSLFRLIINILYDPAEIAFAPAGGSCSGGTCAPGWVLSPDGTTCQKTTSIDATPPSGALIQVAPATNGAYSNFGALLYNAGYSTNGVGVIGEQINSFPWNNSAPNFFDGALNRSGVWGATAVPDGTPIGFSIPIFVPVAKTYYIAVAGDNRGQISVDGVVIVTQDPTAMATSIISQFPVYSGQGISVAFKFWHVYPVALTAGNHYLGVQGINDGGPAGFGAEIYDATPVQLQNAQLDPAFVSNPSSFPQQGNHYSNLTLIFSTRWARGGIFTAGTSVAYSCPMGYGLDPLQTPPKCISIQSVPSSQNQKQWASVTITNTRTSTTIVTLPNVLNQDFQGIRVPHYLPVVNHVDCGGTIQTFLNVQKSAVAIKNDCALGLTGSAVTYYTQAGAFMSTVSQGDADIQAQNSATGNAQPHANQSGTCS